MGLPLITARNPGHLLQQTKLPGQENKEDSKKESWVRAAYAKTGSAAEKHDSWHSCTSCGEARSTRNVTRLKEHLMVCMPILLSLAAKSVPDAKLQQRIARAEAAPPTRMSESTLTMDKASTKRKLMRAFADELTQTETKQLRMLFAEMVVATNLPHSWTQHAAVHKLFKALRPAFVLPSKYDLSTPLLLGVYASIATKVNSELRKYTRLTATSDGWSRTQGTQHITNYQAAVPGASYFLDVTAASTEQVNGEALEELLAKMSVAIVSAFSNLLPPFSCRLNTEANNNVSVT